MRPRWMKGAVTVGVLLTLTAVLGPGTPGAALRPTGQPVGTAQGIAANLPGEAAQAGAAALGAAAGSSAISSPTAGTSITLTPASLPPSEATPDTATPTGTGSSIGLWAADWGGAAGSRSSAGWQAAAKNDSILIGVAGTYRKWIPQLHAWNPNLTILEYKLGPYLQKGSSDFSTILAQDPSWFARDARGNLINLRSFSGNYLMDMGDAAYRAWHASQLAASVAQYGFDGAMDDSMGTAPLGNGYASGNPVNPATHQAYTATQYLDNAVLMLNADKVALGSKYLAFNGLISGTEYAQDTDILATSNANAGVSELFLRQPTSPITSFPTETELEQTLSMMSSMSAHGKALLGWTKVWVNASSAQVASWEDYGLAAYLLGQQAASYWDFMPSRDADNTAVPYSNMKDQLGAPLGPYTVSGSTLTRKFQHGSVTLNTSNHDPIISVT